MECQTGTHRIDVVHKAQSVRPRALIDTGGVRGTQRMGLVERLQANGEHVHRIVDQCWFRLGELYRESIHVLPIMDASGPIPHVPE